jgi:glycosyltransferase involved in cell wall biosynthesis
VSHPTSTAPLRVLHVIASMAPEAGGPPVVCAGLTRALASRGHSIAIATVTGAGESTIPLDPAVKLHAFQRDASPRYAKSAQLDRWLSDHIKNFDIAHLHAVWQFPTFAAARAAQRQNIPYILFPHGMLDRYSIAQRSGFVKRLYWLYREGKVARQAKGIHCLNQAEIRRAVPWISSFPKFVIGNGISETELASLPPRGLFRKAHPEIGERPLALFLSRIHPKKGLDRLIPAWKKLAEKNPDLRLAIAGAGDPAYLAQIDNLIAQHQLQNKILRVGQLAGEQKWQALVDADLFVLPSHQEGFSMAITEALAAGCPPVVTEECNFDELEENPKNPAGIIIKNGDMPAFIEETQSLLADPARRKRFAAAGQELVRTRYTWEKIAADLESVYRHIISGKTLSPDGREIWR